MPPRASCSTRMLRRTMILSFSCILAVKKVKKTIVPDLSAAEIEWLESQVDCKRPMGMICKPVQWTLLTKRLKAEAAMHSEIRALRSETIGLAWNAGIWRFEDQRDLPIFTSERSWVVWINSEHGIAWRKKCAEL